MPDIPPPAGGIDPLPIRFIPMPGPIGTRPEGMAGCMPPAACGRTSRRLPLRQSGLELSDRARSSASCLTSSALSTGWAAGGTRARPLGDVSGVSGRVDAGGRLAGRRGLRLGEGGCRRRGAGSQGEDDDACTVHV
jgi:hypothetical protein